MQPPPPGAPPPTPIHYAPTPPSYGLGAGLGGAMTGVMTALGSCCCGLTLGWSGGVASALLARRRADVFRAREGLLAGFLAGIVGTILFSLITVPLTLHRADAAKKGVPADIQQAANLMRSLGLPASEEQLRQQVVMSGSPVVLLLNTGAHSLLILFVCALGGGALGLLAPKNAFPPGAGPPPGYPPPGFPPPPPGHPPHGYGPPPGSGGFPPPPPGYGPPGYGPPPPGYGPPPPGSPPPGSAPSEAAPPAPSKPEAPPFKDALPATKAASAPAPSTPSAPQPPGEPGPSDEPETKADEPRD